MRETTSWCYRTKTLTWLGSGPIPKKFPTSLTLHLVKHQNFSSVELNILMVVYLCFHQMPRHDAPSASQWTNITRIPASGSFHELMKQTTSKSTDLTLKSTVRILFKLLKWVTCLIFHIKKKTVSDAFQLDSVTIKVKVHITSLYPQAVTRIKLEPSCTNWCIALGSITSTLVPIATPISPFSGITFLMVNLIWFVIYCWNKI